MSENKLEKRTSRGITRLRKWSADKVFYGRLRSGHNQSFYVIPLASGSDFSPYIEGCRKEAIVMIRFWKVVESNYIGKRFCLSEEADNGASSGARDKRFNWPLVALLCCDLQRLATINSSAIQGQSRKQKTERVRRERINSSLDELKTLVCKGEEKQDKLDKADILEATVNFVRNARVVEYQQNPKFRAGYNQCVSEFVQFLVSLENVKADDKAKLLAGMSNVLCGVKVEDENTPQPIPSSFSPTPLPTIANRPINQQVNGKIPIPRLQRQPLQPITNVVTPPIHAPICHSSTSTTISNRGSVSSTVSDSSPSPLSTVSWLSDELTPTQTEEIEPSFGNILDSVFYDASLETSLGEAVGAGIKLELTDLSGNEETVADMVGLPHMCSFLE
eukprot:gene6170-6881_t